MVDPQNGPDRAGGEGGRPGRTVNANRVTLATVQEREDTGGRRLGSVGFNPYNRIRRNRTTRWGDVLYVGVFLAILVALVVWATL